MMGPVPEDNANNNPADNDPSSQSDELDIPSHIIPPADDSSDYDELDSDMEGPANDGYMLLPQDPEEEEGGGETFHFQPQPFPPLSALDGVTLPTQSMTEVRGAGVDMSAAVAGGSVHPVFAANFPDNKVPVHLQVPGQPKASKEDVLWNHRSVEAEHFKLDSAHVSKVKSAMAGFQLPIANIPDWARRVPEDEWKQRVVGKAPLATGTTNRVSAATTDSDNSKESGKQDNQWPGAGGT